MRWVALDWEKYPGEERWLVFPEEESEGQELKKLDDDLWGGLPNEDVPDSTRFPEELTTGQLVA